MLTVLWLAAATVTAVIVRGELDEVFDSALRETAERILPLAVTDIVGREDQGVTQRLAPIREHDELFTYLVRDAEGLILLQSHAADPAVFPPYDGPGFHQTATHRLYSDAALQGTIRITANAALPRTLHTSCGRHWRAPSRRRNGSGRRPRTLPSERAPQKSRRRLSASPGCRNGSCSSPGRKAGDCGQTKMRI